MENTEAVHESQVTGRFRYNQLMLHTVSIPKPNSPRLDGADEVVKKFLEQKTKILSSK
jgi:hypothetical protein